MKGRRPMNKCYLNKFTAEWWRGHEDRRIASDYVTRLPMESMHAPLRFTGRINGQRTEDQEALKSLRAEITREVMFR
jgi:hypothetical protein